MAALLVIIFVLYMARRAGGAARRVVTGEYQREATAYRQRLERDHPDWSPARRNRVAAARAFGAAASDLRHMVPAITRAMGRGWAEARAEWGTTREDHEAWRARHRDEVAEQRERRRQRRRERAAGRGRASGAASPAPEPAPAAAGAAEPIPLPRRSRRGRRGWDEAPAARPAPAPADPADPAPADPADPAPRNRAVRPAPAPPHPGPAPVPPAAGPAPGSSHGPAPEPVPGSRDGTPADWPPPPPPPVPGPAPASATGDSNVTTPTGETTRYEQTNVALGSFSDAAGETLAAAEAVALPVVHQARSIAAAAEHLEVSVGATGMTDATLNIEIQNIRGTSADLAAACEVFEQQRMKVMELAMALDSQARYAQSGHIRRHGRIVEAVHAAGGAARDTRYYGND